MAKTMETPKVLTLDELIQLLLEVRGDGFPGDWPVYLATDEEGNGFRPYWYDPRWNPIGCASPDDGYDGMPPCNIVIG